jgi:AcrR family transcriptional regulator
MGMNPMNSKSRMSCEERKCRILAAVRRVFAHKGLEGTTTRELAKEAGVSEALLYKHYPSKEALYQAMLGSCDGEFMGEVKKITSLESSTSTLVTLVHFMVASLVNRRAPDVELRLRLYLQSILGDGEFARLIIKQKQESCSAISKIADCVKAATLTGDIVESPVPASLRALFADRLAAALLSDLLPAKPAMDYGVPRDKLIEHAVGFILRGFGMKEEAIRRYYNPKALELLVA